jgi:cell division septum initiation protein DivIVA
LRGSGDDFGRAGTVITSEIDQEAEMARGESKDLLTRLADAGEEAIHKLSEAPGADRLFGVASSMRDRVDELQRRVRGLEGIDRRVADLERRLTKLEGGTTRARSAAKRSTTSRARKTTSTSASSTSKGTTSRRTRGASTRKTS